VTAKKIIKRKGAVAKIIKRKGAVAKVEKELIAAIKPIQPKKINPNELVPVGITTFHLECSGRVEGAFQMGTMVNLIGDSHAGKTLLALTVFAECAKLERFDHYSFKYRDIERANEFDIPYLFGQAVADRIESDEKDNLRTMEQFNDEMANVFAAKQPCIYVLDSFDALTTEAALKLDAENRKKRAKGQQTDGSYGDGKPKLFSEAMSKRGPELGNTKSLLIIISQVRTNIGFGSQFSPKLRSGGKALKFYAFHEVWLAQQKKEKERKRTVVSNVQAKITKNKLTGRHGEAYFPVLFDYGIDDVTSCINFLVDEGNWTGTKGAINTQGFVERKIVASTGKKKHKSRAEIIEEVETDGREGELIQLCMDAYNAIIESLRPKRKRKY